MDKCHKACKPELPSAETNCDIDKYYQQGDTNRAPGSTIAPVNGTQRSFCTRPTSMATKWEPMRRGNAPLFFLSKSNFVAVRTCSPCAATTTATSSRHDPTGRRTSTPPTSPNKKSTVSPHSTTEATYTSLTNSLNGATSLPKPP